MLLHVNKVTEDLSMTIILKMETTVCRNTFEIVVIVGRWPVIYIDLICTLGTHKKSHGRALQDWS